MAQPATNPKIEELRGRLKADPKSRFFYQLAEELRRAGQPAEAEQVLRTGLATHPAYLAAWVSLGRTCREQKNDQAAVDALNRALQLDPGNVVAARLLGDAYFALGDKLEAIKKYKLVHALLPSDEELEGIIQRLDAELNPPAPVALAGAPEPEPPSAEEPESPPPVEEVSREREAMAALPAMEQEPAAAPESAAFEEALPPLEESPFDKTQPPFADAGRDEETGDAIPMLRNHDESPFEEPVSGFTAASAQIEMVSGYGIESAPVSAEMPVALGRDDAPGGFAPVHAPEPEPAASFEPVESVFSPVEEPEPARAEEAVPASRPAGVGGGAAGDRVARLERWLGRIRKSEAPRV